MASEESGIGAEGRRGGASGVEVVRPGDPAKAKALATGLDGAEYDRSGTGGLSPDFGFDLEHQDSRGRVWRGHFKARVMTTRDRISIGLTKSRLSGGVSPELLDRATSELLEVMATLTVLVTEAPPWFKGSMDLHATSVLTAIYEEVAKYEARFHGPAPQEAG